MCLCSYPPVCAASWVNLLFASIGENKGADQLGVYQAADLRLCFHYIDSTISLLPKSKISSFYPSPVFAQPGLSQAWSETLKISFLVTRLKPED